MSSDTGFLKFLEDVFNRFFCFLSASFLIDDVDCCDISNPISNIDVLAVVLCGLGRYFADLVTLFNFGCRSYCCNVMSICASELLIIYVLFCTKFAISLSLWEFLFGFNFLIKLLIVSTCVGDVGFVAYFIRVASAAAFDLAVEEGRGIYFFGAARSGLLCF